MDRRPYQSRGFTIIYVGLSLLALCAMTSLAMDFGRVQMVRSELQAAADAASRAGATGVRSNAVFSRASGIASSNNADATSVSLLAADVQSGVWDSSTRTFTAAATPTNAVRVVAQRSTTRSNPVPLTFGKSVGMPTANAYAVSVSVAEPSVFDSVVYNGLVMSNSSYMAGFSSLDATRAETATAEVVGCGAWSMGASTSVKGRGYYFDASPTGTFNNGKLRLLDRQTKPTVSVPGGTYPLGAVNVTAGTSYVAGGATYSCSSVYLGGTAIIYVTGTAPCTVYVTGNVTVTDTAKIQTQTNTPDQMRFVLVGSATITYGSSADVMCTVNAPNGSVVMSGAAILRGSLLCDNLNMSGTSKLLLDTELSTAADDVAIVR